MLDGKDNEPPSFLASIGKGLVEDGIRTVKAIAFFAVIGAVIGAGVGFKLFGGEGALIGAGVGAVGAVLLLGLLYVTAWN